LKYYTQHYLKNRFQDPNKRFGVSLGALSNGRVGLTFYAHGFMSIALTIAIRYAAVRK
jgi:acyl-CoA oxidase